MRTDKASEVIRRLGWLAVLGAIIGAIAGYGLSQVVPKKYDARAEVLVVPSPGTSADDAIGDRLVGSLGRLMDSRSIAESAQASTGVEMSVNEVDEALHASVLPRSSVIQVTARHSNPETAAALSQAAATEFIDAITANGLALGPDEAVDPASDEPTPPLVASIIEESPTSLPAAAPVPKHWMAWGALIGAVVAGLSSTLRRLTDRRVRDSEDLDEISGVPMVGTFGYDRQASRNDLATDLQPQDARFEAARILRTNIQFLAVDLDTTILTFTSALPDEGKSTVVSDLAISIARGGQSVILVEGDLRRPRIGGLFGVPSSVGLTSALIGQVDLDKAIQSTSVPGLDVLASGTRPPNPSELLQTAAMSELIVTLGRRYDIVLIDAPPLLPVTDAALLAEASDGAILVVRHGRTTREQVRLATDRLDAVGADLLGTVLTMVPARAAAKYGYGYEYSAPEGGRRARR